MAGTLTKIIPRLDSSTEQSCAGAQSHVKSPSCESAMALRTWREMVPPMARRPRANMVERPTVRGKEVSGVWWELK